MDKRYLAAGGVGILLVAVVALAFYFLMPKASVQAAADTPTAKALLVPQPDEPGLGDPNAPIKFVEYASSGCGHCAAFAIDVFPKIKENWIDTGKVYYVLRDYPLDSIAAGASMVAHCLPKEQYYPFMDVLFANQQAWHVSDAAVAKEGLITMGRRAGLSPEQVESCLKDQQVLNRIQKSRDDAQSILGVDSTPSMFINGELIKGAVPYDEFEAKFKALLPPAQPAQQK